MMNKPGYKQLCHFNYNLYTTKLRADPPELTLNIGCTRRQRAVEAAACARQRREGLPGIRCDSAPDHSVVGARGGASVGPGDASR